MKKVCLLLFLILEILVSCSDMRDDTSNRSETDYEFDVTSLQNYHLNLGDFQIIRLVQREENTKAPSNNPNFDIEYKMEGTEAHASRAEYVVDNNHNGRLTDPKGQKTNKGKHYRQEEVPVYIDKMFAMYDYTFITYVKDPDLVQRPYPFVEWNNDPSFPTYKTGYEYDASDYFSDEDHYTFIMDNKNGKLYYLEPGTILSIQDWGFIKGPMLSFRDGTVKGIGGSFNYACDYYGQNFVKSSTEYVDTEKRIKYYDGSYDEYIRSDIGDIIHLKFNSTKHLISGQAGVDTTIVGAWLVKDNFVEEPLPSDYCSRMDTDEYHKWHVGGTFINMIKDGCIYTSTGYGNISMDRFCFDNSVSDSHYESLADITNYRDNSLVYWDWDTILFFAEVEGKNNLYWTNVFDNQDAMTVDIDSADILPGHLLVEDVTNAPYLVNNGLAYLWKNARRQIIETKLGDTYKLQDFGDNVISVKQNI